LRLLEQNAGFSEEEAQIQALVAEPVGAAYEQAIRILGERLFAIDGSTTLMRYAAELLMDMDPARLAARANIVDQAWTGVGQDQDRWVAW
jgi:hypothetical protein